MSTPDTLSQRIEDLRKNGYSTDFNLEDEKISNNSNSLIYQVDQLHIDKVYRFEGTSNPDDNSILYAITADDDVKGVLVDGFGVSGGQTSVKLARKLQR
jgi:hypothetical protein